MLIWIKANLFGKAFEKKAEAIITEHEKTRFSANN
jgi:uncharacterized protein (DUF1778 family)